MVIQHRIFRMCFRIKWIVLALNVAFITLQMFSVRENPLIIAKISTKIKHASGNTER
jgi:hypothetical protein